MTALLCVVSLVVWSLAAAGLLRRDGLLRAMLTCAMTSGSDAFQREVMEAVRAQPMIGIAAESHLASQRLMRLCAEAAAGRAWDESALQSAVRWAEQDARNGVSRWCAAWLKARRLAAGGASPRQISDELRRAVDDASRGSTDEREEIDRWHAAIRGLGMRPDVAAWITASWRPFVEPGWHYAVLPAVADAVVEWSGAMQAQGGAQDAAWLRESFVRLLGSVLAGDPPPGTALLCAALIERVAGSAAGEGTGSQPASTSVALGPDWNGIAADARRFSDELRQRMAGGAIDLFTRQPLAAGLAYYAAVALLWATIVLLLAGPCAVALLAAGGIASAIIPARRTAVRTRAGWGRLVPGASLSLQPVLVSGLMLHARLAAGAVTYQAWPFWIGVATVAATALLVWGCLGLLCSAADGASRAGRGSGAAVAGGVILTFVAIAPPVAWSHAERGIVRHPLLAAGFLTAVLVVVGWTLYRWRARAAESPCPALPARAAMAASVWLLLSLAAAATGALCDAADRRCVAAEAAYAQRVAAYLPEDWQARYFARIVDALRP